MKQTKIVASISDRRCDQDFIRKLFFAGMNVVRINTAHATPDGIKQIVENVRAVSPHIGIMIDTKGPEVRTTGVAAPIHYSIGDVVKVFGRPEERWAKASSKPSSWPKRLHERCRQSLKSPARISGASDGIWCSI